MNSLTMFVGARLWALSFELGYKLITRLRSANQKARNSITVLQFLLNPVNVSPGFYGNLQKSLGEKDM